MKKTEISIPPILDSSLITQTFSDLQVFDIKMVLCGEYIQIYKYNNRNTRKINEKKDKNFDLNLKIDNLDPKYKNKKNNELKEIELKNIIRSKLECQRLAKCNANYWKSFITLTFKENITDINYSYKELQKFCYKVKRVYKNFMYLCIPEFQKRGAIHYHLLTNIPINSDIISKKKELQLWNKELKQYKELEYYDIKYWNNGFSSAELIEGDIKKIVGYISKYMTKDIDNKLFSHRRYYYSKNLIKPISTYINLSNKKHLEFLNKNLKNKMLIYKNKYKYNLDNSDIYFEEYIS